MFYILSENNKYKDNPQMRYWQSNFSPYLRDFNQTLSKGLKIRINYLDNCIETINCGIKFILYNGLKLYKL